MDLFLVYFMITYLTATTQPLGTHNILHCVLTLLIKKTRNFQLPSFLVFLETGWLGPILELDTKIIPVVLFFTTTIAGQMNYWSIKNKTKWVSSNLNIRFVLKSIHITLEITRCDFYTIIMGLLAHSWFEIMEFSQILIIPAFWHWKMAA